MRPTWAVVLVLFLSGCGGGTAHRAHAAPVPDAIDAASFLREIGAERTQILQPAPRTIDELETARRASHGAERRAVQRDLARAHLLAAEESTGRDQRRHRAAAMESADAAASGSHDDVLSAEMAFVDLWILWRSGSPAAPTRAERFTGRYPSAGDLTILAWLIRGELATAAEQWNDATTDFRYALGELGHPTYAYALYRTAQCWRMTGRVDDAHQALGEVAALGCAADADDATLRVALQAARDLGVHRRVGTDGKTRPSSCPQQSAATPPPRDIDHETPPE